MDSATTPTEILRLRSQQLALGLIVSFSALPVEFRFPAAADLDLTISPLDMVWNVLFYVPLGLAMRGRGLLRCALTAGGVSLAIESLQMFYAGRYPAATDVVANLGGALLGYLTAGRLPSLSALRLSRRTGGLSSLLALVCIAFLAIPGRPTDLSNWDPGFNLSLGSEMDGTGPWQGELLELAVFSPALEHERIVELADGGPGSIRSFGRQRPDRSLFEIVPPEDLEELRGRPLLDPARRGEFFETLVRRSSLSVATWLRTGAIDQGGLASMMTYSMNRRARNLLLAQYRQRFVFQLRTAGTGDDARHSKMTVTRGPLEIGRDVFVAASYDGHVSRIHVDGRLAARTNLASSTKPIPFLTDSGLPAVAVLVGGLTAAAGLGLSDPGRPRWIVGALAGLIGGALLVLTGGANCLPGFQIWSVVLGGAGGLFVTSAVVRVEPAASDA